ncbi:SOS response-associated peptidase [Ruegeria jejuensis]|uniref:SOS response-associated peptidase n=1 Tax=Ruegeria jejuensis TaxID=3233338 RepID=UPI00355C9590
MYSHTSARQAVLDFTKAMTATPAVGNMPPQPGIYPDYTAPIVRNHDGQRELAMGRWGMPSPAFALKGKKVDRGVTNVRNTKSPHWRRWLAVEHRCVVPFTSFSEPGRNAEGKSEPVWFALNEDRPLAFFAGVWVNWTSVRKVKEGEVNADLYGFLTTEPNDIVGAIHPKAMPVILQTPEEVETWLTAPWSEAGALQRALPDGVLEIVARGGATDGS